MKSHSCALPYETIKNIIELEIEALTPRKALRIFKLKYSLQQLFPLPNKLLTALILFLLTGRFPLLFSSTPSLKFQDQSIKQFYQQELHTSKLTVPHNFEHFVIIAIKLSIKIIENQYVEVVVGS